MILGRPRKPDEFIEDNYQHHHCKWCFTPKTFTPLKINAYATAGIPFILGFFLYRQQQHGRYQVCRLAQHRAVAHSDQQIQRRNSDRERGKQQEQKRSKGGEKEEEEKEDRECS
jgi:hypothetical protein